MDDRRPRLAGAQPAVPASYRGATAPYRGAFGARRPPELARLALPPAPMPSRQGLRPLKKWRYVGVYGPELMLCVGVVRIGPARQAFWAIWDRLNRRLYEHTALGRASVLLQYGRISVSEGATNIELALEEAAGIETVSPAGESYAWTRKQGGIRAQGTVTLDGQTRQVDERAVIDDTAAYYERHTRWRWSAGVGVAKDGRDVAWNLVDGVNDQAHNSERTAWIDGEPIEPPPSNFAADLTAVDQLHFAAEATRERKDNLGILRSRYRQPFGTFSGELAPRTTLATGYGVMEEHDVYW